MNERTNTTVTPILERSDDSIREALSEQSPATKAACLWLKQYAAENGLGLKGLAEQTGISQGSLSPLFNGKYLGDYDAIAARIEHFRTNIEKSAIFGGCRQFVKTKIATSLWKVFERTRYNRRIQIIQSPEQLGKSRAAREYSRESGTGRTALVTLKPAGTSNGFGVFLRDLADAVGIEGRPRSVIELRLRIKNALAACDLVIIDEAHQIEGWSDKAVRAFLDYLRIELHADGERGIILVATNSDVMSLIQSFRKRNRYNVGQLLGRMCNEILNLYPDEIPKSDVRLLIRRYYEPSDDVVIMLAKITAQDRLGHFGLLDDILSRAWSEAMIAERKLTDTLVKKTAKSTMAELADRQKLYEE